MKIPPFRPSFKYRYNIEFIKSFFLRKNIKKKFENTFARYIGGKYAILTSSGTVSLYLCLKSLNCKPGDEIILPSIIVPEVMEVIQMLKLTPIPTRVKKKTLNIDPKFIEKNISKKTKFILMAHMAGIPCDINQILSISKKFNLKIIEDSCQSCGAMYNSKKTGSFGDLSYFSFGILKNLNTLGGGIILTDNKKYFENIKNQIKHFDKPNNVLLIFRLLILSLLKFCTSKFVFENITSHFIKLINVLNSNFINAIFKKKKIIAKSFKQNYCKKYSDFQAKLGFDQLKELRKNNILRNKIGLEYDNILGLVKKENKKFNIYSTYPIKINKHDKTITKLISNGIYASKGYLKSYSLNKNSNKLIENKIQYIFIPIYSQMTSYETQTVKNQLKLFV